VLLHLVANIGSKDDETRSIINKPKHPKKEEYEEQKWKDPCPRKQKKSPKRVNHKGNMKFPNLLLSLET
jgi:hypothetical protein